MKRGQILNVTGLFHGYRYFLKTKPLGPCSVSFHLQDTTTPSPMRRGQILNVTGLFHGYRYFLKTKPLATRLVSFNLQNNNKPSLMRHGQILNVTGLFHGYHYFWKHNYLLLSRFHLILKTTSTFGRKGVIKSSTLYSCFRTTAIFWEQEAEAIFWKHNCLPRYAVI